MVAESPASSTESAGAILRTLVVTDLVESTQLVEESGDRRATEISIHHDRVARDLLAECSGREIDKSDGFLLLFERPIDAAKYALAYHAGLAALSRELDVQLRARVGIHLGEVVLRENTPEDVARGAKPVEVEGLAKPIAARVMSLARAKQTLLTRGAFDLARRASVDETLPAGTARWLAHGPYLFKGVEEPVEIFELGIQGAAPLSVPADSESVRRVVAAGDEIALGWRPAAGLEIPRRPSWILDEKLGEGGFGEVWLATHKQMGEKRVFKFCFDAGRLRGLRREVSLFRLLKEALGHRDDIARVLDWDFAEAPYFLETEHTERGSLVEWAAAQGGIGAVPLATRLDLIAHVAEALGAAHSVGVLHKDVKPANILISADRAGNPRALLTDFGIGLVTDPSLLVEKGITAYGLTEMTSGTQMYMAPEVLEGKVATVQADIYALGVTLYQAVVGDFARALAPGWEREVEDEMLREDVALFVDGAPERRPGSALEIAARLLTLDARRAEREADETARLALERGRRRRRITATVASVTTVFSVVVTAFAIQTANARRVADQRRAQAENVIDFMLADLRTKLEPLGRLDLLDDVGDQAMSYFSAIPAEEFSDDDLASFSQALYQIGDVRIRQGNLPDARVAFEESLRLARELTERDLENPEWLFGLGQSEFWVGYAAWQVGDLDGALNAFVSYLDVSQKLVAKDPDNLDWQLELGYAQSNIGSVREAKGDMEGAVAAFRSSFAIKEALAATDPGNTGWQLQLAEAHNLVGTALRNSGDLKGALDHFQADLALKESLVALDSTHTGWQQLLANTHDHLGSLLEATGDLEGARTHFRAQIALRQRLVARDSSNTRWLRNLAVSHESMGGVAHARGGLGEAMAHYQVSYDILRGLVTKDSTNTGWRTDLADVHNLVGVVLLVRGDPAGALRRADSAQAILAPVLDDNRDDRQARRWLSEANILEGRAWDAMGRSETAQAAWNRALAIIEPLARNSQDRRFLTPWASVLLYLGRVDEARPILSRLEALGSRDWQLLVLSREKGVTDD